MIEIPLGMSEEYDLLPSEGAEQRVPCQGCDCVFIDRERRLSTGSLVRAVLCPDCRLRWRMRFASLLPTARVL